MSERRLGVSYSRFSRTEQGEGDSEDRQRRLFRDFCARHNLTPVNEVFADRGKSGYKDEHRQKGRLGQLIALARDGYFEPGTVIVVEAWDRLGRLCPDVMTAMVSELVRTGVSIGVCRLNDIFGPYDFGSHKWHMFAAFIHLAFQESKQKAERVAESWKKRRQAVRAGERGASLRSQPPAWLEKAADGTARVILERADAVRLIFRLAACGYGCRKIAGVLTARGVKPFGEPRVGKGRGRPQFSGRWTVSYIANILNDRRALGEARPRVLVRRPDGTPEPDAPARGVPEGQPVLGYWPSVVTEEEYELARAGLALRLLPGKDKAGRALASRQCRHVNIFQGLLRHAPDGEGFVLSNRRTEDDPRLVLVPAAAAGGRARGCRVPYDVLEQAVLSRLREVDPAEVLPKKPGASRADVLRATLANARRDLEAIQDDLAQKYSRALAAVLREREAQEEAIAQELQEELAKTVVPAERAWGELPSLVDLVREGGDDARLKLRAVLRRVVESVWVLIVPKGSWRSCAVQVHFVGGKARNYLIVHRAAGRGRKGGWRCWSFAELGVPADGLDLRRRDHAVRLERALAAIDPADLMS
jgi:DNA invertase Pin-like site-specific DNA recombinase